MSQILDSLKRLEHTEIRNEDADPLGKGLQRISPVTGVRSLWLEEMKDVVEFPLSISGPILPFDGTQNVAAEQYRIIRTKVLHHPKKPRLIAVSSASSGDGKTITSINFAASLAMQGDSVLLVDADMRRPNVSAALGIRRSPGLNEVLLRRSTVESSLIRAQQLPNLYILPAGEIGSCAPDLLDSEEWLRFVERVRSLFRIVVFDTTPVAAVADYELIQLICDGVVIVVRPDHSNRTACTKAFQTVSKEKLLGVVLNCVEEWPFWRMPSYRYYQDVCPTKAIARMPKKS